MGKERRRTVRRNVRYQDVHPACYNAVRLLALAETNRAQLNCFIAFQCCACSRTCREPGGLVTIEVFLEPLTQQAEAKS